MRVWLLIAACLCGSSAVWAQSPTCSAPLWSPCDLSFPLQPGEDPASVVLRAEFRSPHRDTRTIHAYLDGARMVLRFTPDEAGDWDYRLTSTLTRLDGQLGKATGTPASVPGFVRTANVHHFQTADLQPHLWMASGIDNFMTLPLSAFEAAVNERAREKFTHIRLVITETMVLSEVALRIQFIHQRGLVTDLAFLTLPETRVAREKYLTEIVARFAAFNITWAGVVDFERLPGARGLMREMGEFLAKNDPYQHPRTTTAQVSSFGMAEDGWMSLLSYGTPDPNVGAVERQLARVPSINTGIRTRADLWNATMNGHYPASGSGPEFAAWFDFFAGTRYWELEPFFDVTGGRAIAVRDVELRAEEVQDAVEYIVYLEKPGPVEVRVQKQSYQVYWFDPATGKRTKGKDFKGEMFQGAPPDTSHDWVLHLSRDGHKEGLLKKYKFESRPVQRQTPEADAKNIPFEVAAPVGAIAVNASAPFRLELLRDTRATRQLLVVWTAELTTGSEGPRVVGTGVQGTLNLPDVFKSRAPGVVSLRVSIVNANGKLYVLDRVFRLTQ